MTHPPLDLEGIRKRLERDEDVIHTLIQPEKSLIQSTSDIRALLAEVERLKDTPGGKRIYGALNEIESLRALLAEAEEALEFYAQFKMHEDEVYRDSGEVAKKTLAKIRQAKG